MDTLLGTQASLRAAVLAPDTKWYIVAPLAGEGILRLGAPSGPIFRKAKLLAIVQDLCAVAGLRLQLIRAADRRDSVRIETAIAAQRHIRNLQLSWGNIVHNCATSLRFAESLISSGNVDAGLKMIADERDKLRSAAHAEPEEIAQGNLHTFLDSLVNGLKNQGINISLRVERSVIDQAPLFSEDVNQAVFDVAQELIHNAIKHARPPIEVRLAYSTERLVLWVIDSGSRGAPSNHDHQGGVTFVLSQVEQMGGTLIAQLEEDGTRIGVTIPWSVVLWGKLIRDHHPQNL
jgi:sensor histidine kinase regulating citrate/malate metabolism